MSQGDWVWTSNRGVYMPDVKITEDRPEYVYVPLRGHCACLAVFDKSDKCIGYIDTRTLGHETAKAWMVATNWKDGGY